MPNALTVSGGPGGNTPGRVQFNQVPLATLIQRAFDVESDQILGPGWISDLSHNYVVSAVFAPETSADEFRAMLQNLLAERFGFRFHWETRSFPGYELRIDPRGLKSSVQRAAETAPPPSGSRERPRSTADGYLTLPDSYRGSYYGFRPNRPVDLKVTTRNSMSGFAQELRRFINMANGVSADVRRPVVVDNTGMEGLYEFRFHFEAIVVMSFGGIEDVAPTGAPTLFEALTAQLGLKLEKTGEVQRRVVVVDSVESVPTAN